jgi:hypothetical protein
MVGALGAWSCKLGHHMSRMRCRGWPCASLMSGMACLGKACGGGQIA